MDNWLIRKQNAGAPVDSVHVSVIGPDTEATDVVPRSRAEAAEREVVTLRAAIEEYALWEPGKRGHAAAHARLLAALAGAGRSTEGEG